MMLGQKRLMKVRQKNTYNNMTTVLEFQVFTFVHFYYQKKTLFFESFNVVLQEWSHKLLKFTAKKQQNYLTLILQGVPPQSVIN